MRRLWLVALLATTFGCNLNRVTDLVQVNVEVVDEKTLLERQILGSYESLSRDLVLVASVRSVDRDGRLVPLPELPPGQRKAMHAMRIQEFYQDDVDRLKSAGTLGENARGMLEIRTAPDAAEKREFATTLVTTINDARQVVLGRILETNEHLSEADRPRVEATMAGIRRDGAKSGEWIQLDDGSWKKKGGA